jgi:alpha-tubulin suppressor-like RCC1 family protein
VTSDGRAYCWGRNRYGALGTGNTDRQVKPAAVQGGLRFNGANAGHEYTCGVTTGDLAYCWGLNHSGRLGDGTGITRLLPVPVAGGLHFGGVTTNVNGFYTCGLTTGKRAYCWGDNSIGQGGNGTTTLSLTPVAAVGPM